VLDRHADAGGRAYWVDRLEAGTSRAVVLLLLTESPENKVRTRAVVDVTEIYHGLLARTPTRTEVTAGTPRVGTAIARTELIEEIIGSDEYEERTADRAP